VPPQLRRWAGLDGDVVVAGAGHWFEVWPQEEFEAIKAREEAELEALDSQ
jgi:MraZ protein